MANIIFEIVAIVIGLSIVGVVTGFAYAIIEIINIISP